MMGCACPPLHEISHLGYSQESRAPTLLLLCGRRVWGVGFRGWCLGFWSFGASFETLNSNSLGYRVWGLKFFAPTSAQPFS